MVFQVLKMSVLVALEMNRNAEGSEKGTNPAMNGQINDLVLFVRHTIRNFRYEICVSPSRMFVRRSSASSFSSCAVDFVVGTTRSSPFVRIQKYRV